MNIRHIIALSVLIIFQASNANAESPFTSGMKYTAINKSSTAPAKTTNIPAETKGPETATPEQQESPTDRVWKKYQALAAGKTESTTEDKKHIPIKNIQPKQIEPPARNSSQRKTATAKPQKTMPAPSGFAAIIESYRQNKEQRSQIRTLRARRPQEQKLSQTSPDEEKE